MSKGSQARHAAALANEERVYDTIRYLVRLFPGYIPDAKDIRVRTQLSERRVYHALQRLRRQGRILCVAGDGWALPVDAPDKP